MSENMTILAIVMAIAGMITIMNVVKDIRATRKIMESIRMYGMAQYFNPKMAEHLSLEDQNLPAGRGSV